MGRRRIRVCPSALGEPPVGPNTLSSMGFDAHSCCEGPSESIHEVLTASAKGESSFAAPDEVADVSRKPPL